MNACISIILGLEALMTFFVVFFSVKKRTFLDRKNLIYFVPALLINTAIYLLGIYYTKSKIIFFDVSDAFSEAVKSFGFQIKTELIRNLFEANVLFRIASVYGLAFASVCTFSTIIGLFKIFIYNGLKIARLSRKENLDIVIGYTEDSLKYLRNYRNSFLLVDYSSKQLNKEEKKKLFTEGIAFLNVKLTAKKLNRLLNRTSFNVNVICFTNDNNYAAVFDWIENTKVREDKIVAYKIQTNSKYNLFLDDQISYRARKHKNVIANSFDSYQLMAVEFIKKFNLAMFIKQKDFLSGALKEDVKINCYFLGFGNTNSAILKSVINNNQFIKIGKNGVENYPINYFIYEKEKEKFNVSYLKFLDEFDNSFEKENELEAPDRICHIKVIQKNLLSDGIYDLMDSIEVGESVYNFFFVALENSFDNNAIANQLFNKIKGNKTIFYKVRSSSEVVVNNSDIIPFGFKKNIINHDNICCEEDYSFASTTNDLYQQTNKLTKSFKELNLIEKYSNIYQDINLRFKLNCLGYDISKDKEKRISKEEFLKAIELEKVKNYDDYFKDYVINNLVQQEHLRWNCFYLLNGFMPMNMKNIRFDENNKIVIHKDLIKKEHACITTFRGLDVLHKHELGIYKSHGINKTIEDVETYKYDIQQMENLIERLEKFSYFVIKKED